MNESKTVVIGENSIGFQSDTIFAPSINTELLKEVIDTGQLYSEMAKARWTSGCRDMRLDYIIHGHFYHAISQTLIALLRALPQTSEISEYERSDVSPTRMKRHLPRAPDLSLLLKVTK